MQIFISHAKPSIIWVFCHPNDWFNSCLGRDQLVNGLQAALPANRPACPLFPSFYSLDKTLYPIFPVSPLSESVRAFPSSKCTHSRHVGTHHGEDETFNCENCRKPLTK